MHVTGVLYWVCNKRDTRDEVRMMKVAPLPGVLQKLQDEMNMTDEKFADYLETSRSSIWRAKLPVSDPRFSLGQDVMAKILKRYSNKKFEDIFFLVNSSHECYKNMEGTKEVG